MKVRISEILHVNGPAVPVCVSGGATVAQAVELMNRHSMGSVLVCERGALVGILTERDVLARVLEPGLDIATTLVESVMTQNPLCVALDDTLGTAIRLMRDQGIAHLPVVDRNGPIGVVSFRDAVAAFAMDIRAENHELLTFIHGHPSGSAVDTFF